MFNKIILSSIVLLANFCCQASISSQAEITAQFAAETYQQSMVKNLAELVKHKTFATKAIAVEDNPAHIAFKQTLAHQAKQLGFDYQDHGSVVIIGLGKQKDRLGVITHGDIQPANAEKWLKSPFELDLTSEPGKLIGRGTEDDKGPIVSVMFAMKAIKDKQIILNKRIELYVYMAEESDWTPLEDFIKDHSLPELNITLDSEYPVVTAEKGYGTISMTFPHKSIKSKSAYLSSFTGGFFGSQIPEDAEAVIENADKNVEKQIKAIASTHLKMKYKYQWRNKQLTITALGKSAHSSKPEDGLNAITHLGELISFKQWPNNASGALVNFINAHLGTDLYGNKFGEIAYQDNFMGQMTVSPTVLKQLDSGIQLNINIRRPKGKTKALLESQINQTLAAWQKQNKVTLTGLKNDIGEPFVISGAPQINTLLSVFSHFTGIKNAQPISIGAGTNSRLFPNAVSFGPSMPNTEYTGHSEHEFITMNQFILNLKMYTAVLIELGQQN